MMEPTDAGYGEVAVEMVHSGDGDDAICGDGGDSKKNEDARVIEVIELDSEDDDEEGSGPEVEDVHEEDMFDFCMDQLANGLTREKRKEARDLLVDNFDELICSADYPMLDVMVEKGHPKEPSTSKAGTSQAGTSQANSPSHTTAPNRKSTQLPLDYYHKRWRKLKKNPVKYKRVLKQMSTYRKQRLEQMTEQEKKAYNKRKNESKRKYLQGLSTEKRRKIKQKNYQRLKTNGPNRFKCKFAGCDEAFLLEHHLVVHERIHLDIEPFACTWPDCGFTAKHRGNVIQHVRVKHFKLPRLQREQASLNIVDDRNPNDYVQVDEEEVKRRL